MNMSKLFYFFILISLKIVFSQANDIMGFYNKVTNNGNDNNDNSEDNDCLCDINREACNYLCCCDDKCSLETRNEWEIRSKCIDKKDTTGIFADRCIDSHLVFEFEEEKGKKYTRRGLKKENATEDISKKNDTIINYCYSIDNSKKMKNEIKSMNLDTSKITDENSPNGNDESRINATSLTIMKKTKILRLLQEHNETVFSNSIGFSLYSGANCENNIYVERFKNANYSCSMTQKLNEQIRDDINSSNIKILNKICSLKNTYCMKDGLISFNPISDKNIYDYETILEVEFIIQMNTFDIIDNCFINIVKTKEINKTENDSVSFKNSVIFSKNGNASYRYSGSNGYLNGLPLKIANKSFVFNEFYITGKNKDGECRLDNNSYDYLYYSDKAILFNQNYSYSCHFNKSSVASLGNTTLFKKLKDIYKIAKYGNSHYSKINDPSYWLEINNTGLNETNINNTSIKMNIYLGTRKIGINSYKYIYKVILKNVPGKNDTLSLKINYFDLDLKQDFEIKPEIPAFIPSMPADLLDPLIYSKVEK